MVVNADQSIRQFHADSFFLTHTPLCPSRQQGDL
jgi:hypothetical protein